MQIMRLENPQDPTICGILCIFPSQARKQAVFTQSKPYPLDTLALAKDMAARVLDTLLREGLLDDAERTNWTSAVAGIQHHIKGWQEALARAQRAAGEAQVIQ